MTCSTVPGYLASAAALALSAAAPVTVLPIAGGVPCVLEGALDVAAAGAAVVVLEEPQPAMTTPIASVAAAPARALRERRVMWGWVIDIRSSSARRARVARAVSGRTPGAAGALRRGGARSPAWSARGGPR